MSVNDSGLSQSRTAKRQRVLREKDRLRGIKHLKLRCTTNESNLIDNVAATKMLTRSEASMALFFDEAKRLGVDVGCPRPELTRISLAKGSDLAATLDRLSSAMGLSPVELLSSALAEYEKTYLELS